jgi:ATP-dependent exoDNAse (exonuclease V) alpha subunit
LVKPFCLLPAIRLRLKNNRVLDFNAREHPHFDHGYAVTSYSSQGLTADRALINIDTTMSTNLVNSRFTYVAVSRANKEALLFTDNATQLGPQLPSETSKTSALDKEQAASVSNSFGIGH